MSSSWLDFLDSLIFSWTLSWKALLKALLDPVSLVMSTQNRVLSVRNLLSCAPPLFSTDFCLANWFSCNSDPVLPPSFLCRAGEPGVSSLWNPQPCSSAPREKPADVTAANEPLGKVGLRLIARLSSALESYYLSTKTDFGSAYISLSHCCIRDAEGIGKKCVKC